MSKVIDDQRQAEHGSPGKVKTAFGAAAGTCVENYDFVAYGTASALYFGDAFFPESIPPPGRCSPSQRSVSASSCGQSGDPSAGTSLIDSGGSRCLSGRCC